MSKQRLLVLSASAGSGHTRAGDALAEAAGADVTVEHWDILDHVSGVYKKAYVASYLQAVNRVPALYGYLYASSHDSGSGKAVQRAARIFDKLEFAGFRREVRRFAPDAVLVTHFLGCQVFGPGRRKGKDRFPLGVVVTDFDVHAFWVEPTAEHTFVASPELRAVLAGRGIEEDRVEVSGIPIARTFSAPHDRDAIRARLGLSADVPTVLLMGGGAGVGDLAEAALAVLGAGGSVQVLAVAGRNEELRGRLERLAVAKGSKLVAFGFVSGIAELMAVADIAVTKSGGLTTSECLAMGVPMIVRDPIPGQEERNCDFLLEAGAALRANGPASLSFKLGGVLRDADRLARLKEAARAAGRPHAARDVVAKMLPAS